MKFNKEELEIIDKFQEWLQNHLENFEINENENAIENKATKEKYVLENALTFVDIIDMYYTEYYRRNKSFKK